MTSHKDWLFTIDGSAATPIYQQLIDQVRRYVAAGTVVPGDRLPSVRAVASALGVNPMTVSKAYAQLSVEGELVRLPGARGMAVASSSEASTKQADKARAALLIPALREAASQARQLRLDPKTAIAVFESLLLNEQVGLDDSKAR